MKISAPDDVDGFVLGDEGSNICILAFSKDLCEGSNICILGSNLFVLYFIEG